MIRSQEALPLALLARVGRFLRQLSTCIVSSPKEKKEEAAKQGGGGRGHPHSCELELSLIYGMEISSFFLLFFLDKGTIFTHSSFLSFFLSLFLSLSLSLLLPPPPARLPLLATCLPPLAAPSPPSFPKRSGTFPDLGQVSPDLPRARAGQREGSVPARVGCSLYGLLQS